MVAVDDGYRCHPTPIRPGAAFRGRAREHPISPFGNERCKRRPGQSGAGRVSPSRRPRPRKPGSSFGRWAPKVQRGPRRHPPYSLKGSVPEAPAYVSVRLCMDLGGGGGAQPRAPLGRSSVQGPRGAALYVLLTDQVCLWILRRRALATSATWRLQFCRNAAYAVRARVATTMRATRARRPSGLAMVTARRQDTPGSVVHCPRVMCCGTTSK